MDEFQESERVGGRRETPGTVRILADMRRCAYDLDFLISRQPRQVFSRQQIGGAVGGGGGGGSTVGGGGGGRTPGVNELEYLDVFDFFNMPRLPPAVGVGGGGGGGGGGMTVAAAAEGTEYSSSSFVDFHGAAAAAGEGGGGGGGNDWLVQ